MNENTSGFVTGLAGGMQNSMPSALQMWQAQKERKQAAAEMIPLIAEMGSTNYATSRAARPKFMAAMLKYYSPEQVAMFHSMLTPVEPPKEATPLAPKSEFDFQRAYAEQKARARDSYANMLTTKAASGETKVSDPRQADLLALNDMANSGGEAVAPSLTRVRIILANARAAGGEKRENEVLQSMATDPSFAKSLKGHDKGDALQYVQGKNEYVKKGWWNWLIGEYGKPADIYTGR